MLSRIRGSHGVEGGASLQERATTGRWLTEQAKLEEVLSKAASGKAGAPKKK